MANVAKKLADMVSRRENRPTTYTGTVVSVGGRYRVLLDGATEPTLCLPEVKAVTGDRVTVEIRNHAARVSGNITHPTTDDAQANEALTQASVAADAATQAQTAAGNAATAASSAQTAAQSAITAAGNAQSAATSATTAASNAQASANTANQAANTALVNLAVIEDVAGTLTWISEHGSYVLTADTTVQDGTVYFELVSGDYVPIATPDPSANPSQQGWYVLDVTDSQSDYIMAHLAITSAGLWVLPSGIGQAPDAQHAAGFKALLASSGMSIFDGSGMIVASYGSETTFYDGLGNAASNIVAKFGRQGAYQYVQGALRSALTSAGLNIYAPDGSTSIAEFGATVRVGSSGGTHMSISSNEETLTASSGATAMRVMIDSIGIDSSSSSTGENEVAYGFRITDGNNLSYISLIPTTAHDENNKLYFTNTLSLFVSVDKARVSGEVRVEGHSGPIGETFDASLSANVETSKAYAITELQLMPGTWVIEGNAGFASNATGRRIIDLSTADANVSDAVLRQTGVEVPAVSGGMTALHTTWITKRTAQTTIYLNVYQNSGSSLGVTGYIRAVRIA